jgi:hypothetical protein
MTSGRRRNIIRMSNNEPWEERFILEFANGHRRRVHAKFIKAADHNPLTGFRRAIDSQTNTVQDVLNIFEIPPSLRRRTTSS